MTGRSGSESRCGGEGGRRGGAEEECDRSNKQCDLKGMKAAEDKVAESRRRRC